MIYKRFGKYCNFIKKKIDVASNNAKSTPHMLKTKQLPSKLNDKKHTSKTNSKGVAKFTIKKSVISKLKVDKKYKISISYLKDTLKRTLKIKR